MATRKLKAITAWVSQEIKDDFSLNAKKNGTTDSKLLALLVNTFLKRNPLPQGKVDDTEEGKKVRRVEIGLTANQAEELNKRSVPMGMSGNAYVAALLRTHVKHAPYFSEEELNALREANRQLAALGKNVNQIARALNTSLDNADLARAAELDQVRQEVEQHRQAVANMVRQNMKAWRIGHGDKSE